jgi:hypothetical protein
MNVAAVGDGLVVRRATADDAEPVAVFVADVLRRQDAPEPSTAMGAWVHDLVSGRHPSVRAEDCFLVTDKPTGAIVSCATLISQQWSFGGVRVAVGQPELIGTRAGQRGRRLVTALMEAMHRESAARGHHLLSITGIPWFYRQFGYELALERGGGPMIPAAALADLDPAAAAAYRVRPATEPDAPFLASIEAEAARRNLVWALRDERLWRYEIAGHCEQSAIRRVIDIVERPDGAPVGYVMYAPRFWRGAAVAVIAFEVSAGVSWRAVWIPLLAHLKAQGEAVAARDSKTARITRSATYRTCRRASHPTRSTSACPTLPASSATWRPCSSGGSPPARSSATRVSFGSASIAMACGWRSSADSW